MNATVPDSFSPPAKLSSMVETLLNPTDSLSHAQSLTRQLAHAHYENFSVISTLLPKHLRQDFCNVYAFCRIADDLGDEIDDPQTSLNYLAQFREQLRECYQKNPTAAVFVALADTISRHSIPIEPFLDLIDAFEQDQRVHRYQTFEELLDYCRRSANPVGSIVLYMCGYSDAHRQQLSDFTCTALQLANFWQDVRRDISELDRIYLPADSMKKFGVTEEQIRQFRCDENFRALLKFEVDRTEDLFAKGESLPSLLDASVRSQIALFTQGGRAILQAIRKQNYDTLSHRPSLSALQKSRLIARVMTSKIFGRFRRARA